LLFVEVFEPPVVENWYDAKEEIDVVVVADAA